MESNLFLIEACQESQKIARKDFLKNTLKKRKETAAWIVKLLLSPGSALAHNQLNKEVISV